MNDPAPPPLPEFHPPRQHQQPQPAPQPRSSWKGCLLGGVITLAVVMGLPCVLGVFTFMGVIGSLSEVDVSSFNKHRGLFDDERGADDYPLLEEVWASGNGDAKVIRVHINGLITTGGDRWNLNHGSADLALAGIRRATRDKTVRGLLLELDSPGGGITASDVLHKAVRDFKQEDASRFVIVLMHDLAASGAYYIACAADEIIAHPTSLTGSIGVILQTYNISGLAAMVGVTDVTVKSGANKDLLNPFRPVDQQQVDALLQPIIDTMHGRFVDIVSEGRNLPRETVLPLADGRLFDAPRALENHLIDATGYRADAEARMAARLGATLRICRYEESLNFSSLFRRSFMRFEASGKTESLAALFARDNRLMYLWQP